MEFLCQEDAEQRINKLEKQVEGLREALNNLPTYEIEESPGNPYESYRIMVDQKKPLSDSYCGDYVEVDALKKLLKETGV